MPHSLPRVLLADDHLMLAKGLERLLEEEAEVVATVGDGRTLLTAASVQKPDVIVCDISMPEQDGLEATRRLVEKDPEAKVVILSMHDDAAHVKGAFQAGARGYVTKSSAPDELLTAIREVVQGHCYISPSVTRDVVRSFVAPANESGELPLTQREWEVAVEVAKGCTNAQVAERLCITQSTVRSHLSHLYARLGVSNRVELALHAVRAGWFNPGEDPEASA